MATEATAVHLQGHACPVSTVPMPGRAAPGISVSVPEHLGHHVLRGVQGAPHNVEPTLRAAGLERPLRRGELLHVPVVELDGVSMPLRGRHQPVPLGLRPAELIRSMT